MFHAWIRLRISSRRNIIMAAGLRECVIRSHEFSSSSLKKKNLERALERSMRPFQAGRCRGNRRDCFISAFQGLFFVWVFIYVPHRFKSFHNLRLRVRIGFRHIAMDDVHFSFPIYSLGIGDWAMFSCVFSFFNAYFLFVFSYRSVARRFSDSDATFCLRQHANAI